ncbi:MAG: TetR/AcrR family transcriptional regulator [Actinomycetota bacterium]|nr:TetR/AcrR family transcriptional regulator [Actinomycetota bacterium]
MTVTANGRGRRDEIVVVASRLLRKRGLELQLQDIADELGITSNALYYHFRNREDLLLQCFLRAGERVDEALAVADEQPTGLERVMTFLETWLGFAFDEAMPPVQYSASLNAESQQALNRPGARRIVRLRDMIEKGRVDGTIAAECDALVTSAQIFHTLYWWPDYLHGERSHRQIADAIFANIRRSLAA